MQQTSSRPQRPLRPSPSRLLALVCLCVLGLGLPRPPASPAQEPAKGGTASYLRADPLLAGLAAATEPLPFPLLIDAALAVSGVSGPALPARRAQLTELLDAAARALGPVKAGDGAAELARAEAALAWLHEGGVLRGYREGSTTLVDILDRGAYNCVSSALLYLLVLRGLGGSCVAVRTSDHAFCLVRIGGRDIDVETTNRYGFDPGTRKEFTDSFGKATGYSYVPPGDYRRRELLGERQLLSLVLSNRSALLEEAGRYAEALVLGASFAALAGGTEGRTFLLDRINNLAATLATARRWPELRSLVAEGRAMLGDDPRLMSLAAEAADAALSEAIGRIPFGEALAQVEASARAGEIGAARRKEYLVFLYGSEANRIGKAGDWLAAAALADEGSRATGQDRSLATAAANFRRNFAVGVHNRFASLYNARSYAEARAAVEEGLRLLPGDATLIADLAAAKEALKGR